MEGRGRDRTSAPGLTYSRPAPARRRPVPPMPRALSPSARAPSLLFPLPFFLLQLELSTASGPRANLPATTHHASIPPASTFPSPSSTFPTPRTSSFLAESTSAPPVAIGVHPEAPPPTSAALLRRSSSPPNLRNGLVVSPSTRPTRSPPDSGADPLGTSIPPCRLRLIPPLLVAGRMRAALRHAGERLGSVRVRKLWVCPAPPPSSLAAGKNGTQHTVNNL